MIGNIRSSRSYIIVLCSICIQLLGSCSIYAQDPFQELELFRDETLAQTYELEEYQPLMDVQRAQFSLSQLSASYDEMQQSIQELEQRKDDVSSHYQKAKIAIRRIVQDMKTTQSQLLQKQRDITLTIAQIRSLETTIQLLTQDIQETQTSLQTYARMLFKVTNDYFLSDSDLSSLKVLSKSNNVAQTLSKNDLMALLYASLDRMFWRMDLSYQQYTSTLTQIQQVVAQHNQEIEAYRVELKYLEQQRDYIIELFTFLRQDKSVLESRLTQADRSRQEIQKEMSRMSEIASSTTTFLDTNSAVYDLLQEYDMIEWPRYFSWPVRVVSDLLDLEEVWAPVDQQWVVLDVRQGESVHAPAPGIVYKVSRSWQGWINRVILLHKYWRSTILMPLEDVLVEQWSVVKRWEIIGIAWGKPWIPWSWSYSLRPHLYVELLKHGEPVDPMLSYDLGVFNDHTMLDSQYLIKRQQDRDNRRVDLSEIIQLQWETVQERRDYFLRRSAGPVFSDPTIRLRAAAWTWIDPIFGICIGAAETSFRNFKTWNNIWNVWNTDSWATRTFTSPEAWVRAVFNTLNNQFLGQYHTMDQLSRFGNQYGYIYASSSFNRQKNIMRCLSMIYNQPVSEQYFFRDISQQ